MLVQLGVLLCPDLGPDLGQGGTPIPGQDGGGGSPSQVRTGGIPPPQVRTRGYPQHEGRGIPFVGKDGGTTPSPPQKGWGVPLSGLDGGTPPPGRSVN